jgi:hypothetical protein
MNILYNQQARMTACLLEVARILCLHVIEENYSNMQFRLETRLVRSINSLESDYR